jgi:methionyl-tRNA formyltransferase
MSRAGSCPITSGSLATRDGRLVLDEVQPAGGRPMTGEAFLRGRPAVLGWMVGDRSVEPA